MNTPMRLCLALDRSSYNLPYFIEVLLPFRGKVGVVKVHTAFIQYGRKIVDVILGLGFRVWVDLKCHGTPGEVAEEISRLKDMGIQYASIHLSGCSEMIKAAIAATGNHLQSAGGLRILGITVLTTTDKKMLNEELRVPGEVVDQVLHLVDLGINNGMVGFVCSGLETLAIRQIYGQGLFIATPGIRLIGSDWGAHKRVVTPEKAIRNGSNLLVMGGELLNGGPKMADLVLNEIEEAMHGRGN